jgi:hypothetical protein
LSNEWFSMISTTMCSISGIVAVPAGLAGKGRLSGCRRPDKRTTGLAQAGRPRVASSAAPPAPAFSSIRRVRLPGTLVSRDETGTLGDTTLAE